MKDNFISQRNMFFKEKQRIDNLSNLFDIFLPLIGVRLLDAGVTEKKYYSVLIHTCTLQFDNVIPKNNNGRY